MLRSSMPQDPRLSQLRCCGNATADVIDAHIGVGLL
jgi:hypothetical protein